MTRPRKPTAIESARAEFCKVRRHPDHFVRWMAWIDLRGAIEGWDAAGDAAFEAKAILMQAESWKRGFRPPQTFHEAAVRARRRQRDGRLRMPGDPG